MTLERTTTANSKGFVAFATLTKVRIERNRLQVRAITKYLEVF